ncbi:MAG: sigma-70 family RNA polymerase sigma factor [Heteroscytonema crispum UTEX LB 1556]
MHPRQNIIDIFSTFVQFDADRFRSWATDAKLRRSMLGCINQTPQENCENFWVLYWYNLLQKSPRLAREHLVAYLQESCYWTSQKTAASFNSTQYRLSDCFQIAIAQVDRVLKGFNPNQGFILKNYASAIFASVIRETLRQRHEVDICSDWGMLRKISQKRLVAALQAAGLPPDNINACVLAWNCFKMHYAPIQVNTARQLTRPDNQTWEVITKEYNSQANSQSSQKVNPQTLEKWLLNSAKAARQYLYPSVTSINISAIGENSAQWVENLPQSEQDSLLYEMISQEEQQTRTSQLSQMNQVLVEAIAQLEAQAQKILQLYYAQGLTQQEIAKQLQLQQYTVSRRLTKARETLLRTLANWSQETLHISVTSDLLKSTSAVMEEWLQAYYSPSPN